MHIHFCGIGGSGIGPLAVIAHQAGYDVSGSDKQYSTYIDYVKSQGISTILIENEPIEVARLHDKHPIDWLVYASALEKENPNHPMLVFARMHGIRHTKRDALLNEIISRKHLKLIAIAGTHGKTTTTAMVMWLFKELAIPASFSVGAKSSFANMGVYTPGSEYFIYECDEYDRNFLSFYPYCSLISGIDWDHPDIYPTREDYEAAFREYINQSDHTIIWEADASRLGLKHTEQTTFLKNDDDCLQLLELPGEVNRRDAWLTIRLASHLFHTSTSIGIDILNRFPGVSRRFEKITDSIYSDYAHTPEKIRGTLEVAREVAGNNFVVVYEGLHNTRQHFIKDSLAHLFDDVPMTYVVPSYLARENTELPLLSPRDIIQFFSRPDYARVRQLDTSLLEDIRREVEAGKIVVCLSAGGTGSLDEWLRNALTTPSETPETQ